MVCCVPIISLISTFSLGCAYGSGYFCSQQFCGKVKDKTTPATPPAGHGAAEKPTSKKCAEVIVNKKSHRAPAAQRAFNSLKILELWKQDLKSSIKEKIE